MQKRKIKKFDEGVLYITYDFFYLISPQTKIFYIF